MKIETYLKKIKELEIEIDKAIEDEAIYQLIRDRINQVPENINIVKQHLRLVMEGELARQSSFTNRAGLLMKVSEESSRLFYLKRLFAKASARRNQRYGSFRGMIRGLQTKLYMTPDIPEDLEREIENIINELDSNIKEYYTNQDLGWYLQHIITKLYDIARDGTGQKDLYILIRKIKEVMYREDLI
jgi:hypothetical protein